MDNEPLTNTLRPATDAIITVRVIKSFRYRTEKNLVLHVDLTKTTVDALLETVNKRIQTDSAFRPFRTVQLDTIKLYTQAHAAKTTNLIINLDHDDWILEGSRLLVNCGVQNETELSAFNLQLYREFQANPETSW